MCASDPINPTVTSPVLMPVPSMSVGSGGLGGSPADARARFELIVHAARVAIRDFEGDAHASFADHAGQEAENLEALRAALGDADLAQAPLDQAAERAAQRTRHGLCVGE